MTDRRTVTAAGALLLSAALLFLLVGVSTWTVAVVVAIALVTFVDAFRRRPRAAQTGSQQRVRPALRGKLAIVPMRVRWIPRDEE